MNLGDSVTSIKGVGQATANLYSRMNINTVGDLINHYPRKYDDYSTVDNISKLKPGKVTIKAKISHQTSRYSRRGINVTEAIASDNTGSVRLVWFNQPYRASGIDSEREYFIQGDFELQRQKLAIINPSIELVSDFPIHSARIVSSYPLTKGLKSTQIRKTIKLLLPEIRRLEETLPNWIINKENLLSFSDAIEKLHFPSSTSDIEAARNRLGFEELFQAILSALLNKVDNRVVGSLLIEFKKDIANKFVKSLPFSLTNAQRKAVWQIYQDLAGSTPMNRLLEGDVGSGKTVVACMVTLMVIESGYQVAIMAPTEILARQHAETFRKLLKPLGYGDGVVLLIGSMNVKQKHLAYKSIEDGRAKVVIGTSTLIQEKVTMKNLALVIIDEQHRFGVDQRKKLQRKAGRMPHVLSMTATPIPRSLALVLYGDLDITIVNDKPENRKPVKTCIVLKRDEQKIHDVIKQEVNNGRQAYIVSPIIEEGESATSSSAKQTFNKVQQLFSGVSIGLLHGKLSKEEKERTMQKFQKNEIAILVTTTVIEVGVDIPNATVIVIQDPERFGLAQIHQLRGRVGRADHDSYCFLSLSNNNKPSQRLHALESKHSGFELAELDLELRGPGEIYGITQHGHLDLRMAKLSDTKMISAAKKAAEEFIARKEKLIQYKELHNRVNYLRKITNLN